MAGIPAMASTLCPGSATQKINDFSGGPGNSITASSESGPCSTAETLTVNPTSDEAKLMWATPGLTFSTLTSIDASVSNVTGITPYFMLSFSDNSIAHQSGDEMLFIEFQPNNVVGGNSMPVDPNTTLFNILDNATEQYYDWNTGTYQGAGQQVKKSLADWASDLNLGGASINKIEIAEGLSGSCNGACSASVTVNSVALVTTTPEPGTIVSVATGLLCLGSGLAFRRRKLVQAV